MYYSLLSLHRKFLTTKLLRFSINYSNSNILLLFRFQRRYFSVRKKLPYNTLINFVPQQEAWVVERFGKFLKVLDPGLNYLIPIIDEIRYVQSLKETAIEIPSQTAITEDNVTLNIDGVLYYRVVDPFLASYGIEDGEFAVVQLGQTTMRSELGKIKLDEIFQERALLNLHIVAAINQASSAWGISCLRYEIKDISVPHKVKEAMQMMVAAERSKRAKILESEGIRESEINVAMGVKQARILLSEAEKLEKINHATGESEASILIANGQAKSIDLISNSLKQEQGHNSASLSIAKQYVHAFSQLAKESNTLILPLNSSDIVTVVSQAMTIYNQLTTRSKNNSQLFSQKLSTPIENTNESNSIHTDSKVEFDSNLGQENLSIYDSPTIKT